MHELEVRYRRLMAAYPWRYRREYEEEMVGVLMAEAAPGQRWPRLRDRADLMVNALAVRLRGVGGGLRSDDWRRAATMVQLAGALAMLVLTLRRAAFGTIGLRGWTVIEVARPAAWAVALVLGLCALRRLAAAAAAVVAVAVEVVNVAGWYTYSPSQVLKAGWLVVGALTVAVAAVWRATGPAVPAPRGLWLFAVAAGLGGGATIADWQQGGFFGGTFEWAVIMDGQFIFRIGGPLYLAAAVVLVIAWWRQGGAVRRRLLALSAPMAATALMVSWGFAGFMYSSQSFNTPVYLAGFQWAILAATPIVAFALAAAILGRWERLAHLIRLGRRAEA